MSFKMNATAQKQDKQRLKPLAKAIKDIRDKTKLGKTMAKSGYAIRNMNLEQ